MSRGLSDGMQAALIVTAVLVVFGGLFLVFVLPTMLLSGWVRSDLDGGEFTSSGTPVTVTEGRAFSLDGLDFARGWVVDDEVGHHLRPTRIAFVSGEDSGYAEDLDVTFTFFRGTAMLGVATCSADDVLEPGSPNSMTCVGTRAVVTSYDRIEVRSVAVSSDPGEPA